MGVKTINVGASAPANNRRCRRRRRAGAIEGVGDSGAVRERRADASATAAAALGALAAARDERDGALDAPDVASARSPSTRANRNSGAAGS